jgi:hypothetical protein
MPRGSRRQPRSAVPAVPTDPGPSAPRRSSRPSRPRIIVDLGHSVVQHSRGASRPRVVPVTRVPGPSAPEPLVPIDYSRYKRKSRV